METDPLLETGFFDNAEQNHDSRSIQYPGERKGRDRGGLDAASAHSVGARLTEADLKSVGI